MNTQGQRMFDAVLTVLHIIWGVVLSLILDAEIKKQKHHTHISKY
jgi:hypothetical protein